MSSAPETAQADSAGEPQAPQTAAAPQDSAGSPEAPKATASEYGPLLQSCEAENARLRAENAQLERINSQLKRTLDDFKRQFDRLVREATSGEKDSGCAWGD